MERNQRKEKWNAKKVLKPQRLILVHYTRSLNHLDIKPRTA